MHTPSTAEILKRLANYSTEVKGDLVRKNIPEYDAEDIVQTAFIKALENLHTLRDPNNPEPWFRAIVRNAVVDYYRERERERRRFGIRVPIDDALNVYYHDTETDSMMPDKLLADKMKRYAGKAIRYAMKKIPVRERVMFTLYYWDNMTWKEIAKQMNMTHGAVRTAVSRRRDEFASYLIEYYEKEFEL